MPRFDSMEPEKLETEINQATARFSRITAVPAVQCYPVTEFGAAVLAFDHQTDRPDQRSGLPADNRERRTRPIDPGRTMQPDPLCGSAGGGRVRGVERGAGA